MNSLLEKYDKTDKRFLIAKELMRKFNPLMVSNRMHIGIQRFKMVAITLTDKTALKNPMGLYTLTLKGSIISRMLAYDEQFIDFVMQMLPEYKDIDNLTEEEKLDIILYTIHKMYGSFDCIENREAKFDFITSFIKDEENEPFLDVFKIALIRDFEDRINKFEAKLKLMENSVKLLYCDSVEGTS